MERVDSNKPNMGLMTWKKSPNGKILKSDVSIAKNYLNQDEMKKLERLTNLFFDYAEDMVLEEHIMTMKDWINATDDLLKLRKKKILKDSGSISHETITNNITSTFPTSIDYDASKAAVISLTHNFALEYAPYVLVNSIAPGWVNTEMNKQLPKELIDEECEKIYLKRFAEPSEVANLVSFLASDECTYINGEIIKFDGGY